MCSRLVAASLPWVLFAGRAAAHWNSAINLDGGRRLQEGSDESINAKWQCEAPDPAEADDVTNDPNAYHLRGVNLGSWMVLEPWITPSMFFQFLGKSVTAEGEGESDIGMDMYTFCEALGAEEVIARFLRCLKSALLKKTRRLEAAEAALTATLPPKNASCTQQSDIAQLATVGVNTIRLPVGDWMYKPYGPYVGCTDGSLDEVQRLFELCHRYGIRVLLDIHAIAGSQNGFDNSGQAMDIEWTTYSTNMVSGTATFVHWPYRAARWMGDFDRRTGKYTSKNETAIEYTLAVIQTMVDMYANESVVMGLQPVNEPWQFTPLDWLKDFYWKGYHIVREQAPKWLFLMHDSFHFDVGLWGDFMKNCPTIGLDTHIYQAWNHPGPQASYLAGACDAGDAIKAMEQAGMPVIVGEWSLATDNCAMWLNGFQDNLPGFPQVQCKLVRCPLPYMGGEQPGAPVDPNSPPLGPFGTGSSTPSYGNCPIDGEWHSEDDFMTSLAYAKLNALEKGHGWFFWNFKTELEVRWDYLAAVEKGYFPYHVDNLEQNEDIKDACNRFNGRYPVKGMPPGIYSEDERQNRRWSSPVVMLLVVASVALAFVGVKVVRRRSSARGWQVVRGDGDSSQGDFAPPTMSYQEAQVST